MFDYFVDEDISKAETLPASFYKDDRVFDLLKTKVFTSSWQWEGCAKELFPEDDYIQLSLIHI